MSASVTREQDDFSRVREAARDRAWAGVGGSLLLLGFVMFVAAGAIVVWLISELVG
jgi:hypothetical protein